MPFSITKKEKMTESMTDYLDQINKKVSRIQVMAVGSLEKQIACLLYTSPSPRD